jgi:hypothetical protein
MSDSAASITMRSRPGRESATPNGQLICYSNLRRARSPASKGPCLWPPRSTHLPTNPSRNLRLAGVNMASKTSMPCALNEIAGTAASSCSQAGSDPFMIGFTKSNTINPAGDEFRRYLNPSLPFRRFFRRRGRAPPRRQRVASAVGEDAMALTFVHRYFTKTA